MLYKEFKDLKLSSLGLGTMRLPTKEVNGKTSIDSDETAKMVEYAINKGINYFDTAWGYHDGESELVIGKVLQNYPRESFYLATKFPGYDLSNMNKVEEIFEKQLEKTGMEYFDFYLIHNVYERNVDPYLDPQYGILEYLLKQKENGRIKHLGFSIHGSFDVMQKFMNSEYGKHMEFCQVQLNYLDYEFQDAKAKVEFLNEHNIPVWVMEPLRGGKLANLSEENESKLKELRPDETVPAWAFRFLQTLPGVTMVLSGMSNMEQLEQNIKTFEEDKKLNDDEMNALIEMARNMVKGNTLPCTACRYCTAHCPKGIDIPKILSLYNEHVFTGGGFIAPMVISSLPDDKKPSACIGCKSCEAVCPQQLKIAEAMSNFTDSLK